MFSGICIKIYIYRNLFLRFLICFFSKNKKQKKQPKVYKRLPVAFILKSPTGGACVLAACGFDASGASVAQSGLALLEAALCLRCGAYIRCGAAAEPEPVTRNPEPNPHRD